MVHRDKAAAQNIACVLEQFIQNGQRPAYFPPSKEVTNPPAPIVQLLVLQGLLFQLPLLLPPALSFLALRASSPRASRATAPRAPRTSSRVPKPTQNVTENNNDVHDLADTILPVNAAKCNTCGKEDDFKSTMIQVSFCRKLSLAMRLTSTICSWITY